MVKQTDSILRIRKKQSLAFFDAVLVGCLVVMAVIFAGVAAYTGLRGDDYGVLQGYSVEDLSMLLSELSILLANCCKLVEDMLLAILSTVLSFLESWKEKFH